MSKLRWLLCVVLLTPIALVACVPAAPSGAPRPCTNAYTVDGAIDCAFAPYGLQAQNEAHSVAVCESGKVAWVTNGIYRGLFQLGPVYYDRIAANGGNYADPYTNAKTAADLGYNEIGHRSWQQWECKP